MIPKILLQKAQELEERARGAFPDLASLAKQCFLNTIETTVTQLEDGSYFVITGDIPAMWLRDSAAQLRVLLFQRPQPEERPVLYPAAPKSPLPDFPVHDLCHRGGGEQPQGRLLAGHRIDHAVQALFPITGKHLLSLIHAAPPSSAVLQCVLHPQDVIFDLLALTAQLRRLGSLLISLVALGGQPFL